MKQQPSTTTRVESQKLAMSQRLVTALALDVWPGAATCVDFGIGTQRHYAALQYVVAHCGVRAPQLAAVACNGPAITRLVAEAAGNDLEPLPFVTPWDELPAEPDWDQLHDTEVS